MKLQLRRKMLLFLATMGLIIFSNVAFGTTTVFFDTSMAITSTTVGDTSDSITSCGYVLTYSLDKWWYPGISLGSGVPTGRPVSFKWPEGITAQTITAGPSGLLSGQGSATLTIRRADGQLFALSAFTAKILGSTAGAGAAFEIMPQLNGNDGFANPLTFDATGYAGQSFSYNTPTLDGFDTYNLSLWMDFSATSLVLIDASPAVPRLTMTHLPNVGPQVNWSTNLTGYTLEFTTDPASQSWTPVSDPVAIRAGSFVVTPQPGPAARFFRLRKL